eukprot:1187667-Prorocentrum_minimum.AAC.7
MKKVLVLLLLTATNARTSAVHGRLPPQLDEIYESLAGLNALPSNVRSKDHVFHGVERTGHGWWLRVLNIEASSRNSSVVQRVN